MDRSGHPSVKCNLLHFYSFTRPASLSVESIRCNVCVSVPPRKCFTWLNWDCTSKTAFLKFQNWETLFLWIDNFLLLLFCVYRLYREVGWMGNAHTLHRHDCCLQGQPISGEGWEVKLCRVFRVVAGNSLLSVQNGEWDGKKWQTTSQDCLGVLLGFGLDLPRNTRLMGGNAALRD